MRWRDEGYRDRDEAGRALARALADRALHDPVVLAIPRGGIEVAAPLAEALGADLDVVLARKLRAPMQPELAIGALAESGAMHLNAYGRMLQDEAPDLVERERDRQAAEIARRRDAYRAVRPAVALAGRSVLVVDDGIATGSTMLAALEAVRADGPREVLCCLPVAPADGLEAMREAADEVVCLLAPPDFRAVGQYYDDFEQVSDARVIERLRAAGGGEPRPGRS